MAQIHYMRLEQAPCLAEIERILELNPHNSTCVAMSALFLTGLGQMERGQTLIKLAMRLNPHHPGWYHLIPFLHHYSLGDYEAALVDANQFNTPEYFWDPLIRSVVMRRLGHLTEAKNAGLELLSLVPDFKQRGRSLIKRMVFLDEYVDMLWDAWLKVGIQDPAAPVDQFKGAGVD